MRHILVQELETARVAIQQSASALGAGKTLDAHRHLLELRTSCIVLADLLDSLREPGLLRRKF